MPNTVPRKLNIRNSTLPHVHYCAEKLKKLSKALGNRPRNNNTREMFNKMKKRYKQEGKEQGMNTIGALQQP